MAHRRSRWSRDFGLKSVRGMPTHWNIKLSDLDEETIRSLVLRFRLEEIQHQLSTNEYWAIKEDGGEVRRNRSPSPEPVYDAQGKRVNTREQRAKDKLMRERNELIERAKALNPHFVPPSDYKPTPNRKIKKIYMKDPSFIGQIIGPRGLTHKELEKTTGAKISIRGKGSVVAGKGKQKPSPDDDDELHVLITADTDEQLKMASDRIEELLIPRDDANNPHKQSQLEMLAKLNGTYVGDRRRRFAPDELAANASGVRCRICGEQSHPTADCPQKGKVENEYQNFLSMLDSTLGNVSTSSSSSTASPPNTATSERPPWELESSTTPTTPPAASSTTPPWLQNTAQTSASSYAAAYGAVSTTSPPGATAAPWETATTATPPGGAPWEAAAATTAAGTQPWDPATAAAWQQHYAAWGAWGYPQGYYQ